MSRTTDAIIKSQDTPWLLTPHERAFCHLDDHPSDANWEAELAASREAESDPKNDPTHREATDAEWWLHMMETH